MSRCFPFPPPGYEKKARPDDVNWIIKEKHKEKKHKDKKDKDKKEKSKRKEKEKTEGKLKEDKDRKRKKHRDKKDKKDKRHSSEEGSVVYLDNQIIESLGPQSRPSDGNKDHGITVELGRRIGNDGEVLNIQMAPKIMLINTSSSPGEVKESRGKLLAEGHNVILDKRERSSMDNGHCYGVDNRGVDAVVGNIFGESQNQVDNGTCQVQNVKKRIEQKENNVHQSSTGWKNENEDKIRKAEKKKRKEEKKKDKVRERSKELVKQNGIDMDFHKKKPQGILKEGYDNPSDLLKLKKPELNGLSLDNGIQHVNMSRPASSSHQERPNQTGFGSPQTITNSAVEKGDVVKNHTPSGKLSSNQPLVINSRDVKDQNANNFTADHGGPTIKNHTVLLNNGLMPSHPGNSLRKMDPCQSTLSMTNVEDRLSDSHKTDIKIPSRDSQVENGKIEPPNTSAEMNKKDPRISNVVLVGKKHAARSSSSASVITVEKDVKPPHPDLKYLNKILTVPDLEWPKDDEQEWLFGSENSPAKRPKLASSIAEQTQHVWAKAMPLESANVTALPYVVPY